MLTPVIVPGRRHAAPDDDSKADQPDRDGTADQGDPADESGKDEESTGTGAATDRPSGDGGDADGGVADGEPAATTDQPEVAAASDPEQVLANYEWRFHADTLRELVENPDELRELRDQLTEKLNPATDNPTRARLLSLRAVVSRILGELGKAMSDGKLALAHAEATGQLRRIAIAQARLAHVLQWRGDFAEADRLFALANSPELPERLRATMHEHAGRSCFDQGRYIEACNHFERALDLRKVEDPDLIERTDLALDAVTRKMAENGIGPYPRTPEEILQLHRPPGPTFDEQTGAWGYANEAGELVIAPAYADVQPFRDSVAWVRRQEAQTWELIDESGTVLIPANAGWLGVGSFSEGLGWVSRDGAGNWIAIDKVNNVVISTGFDDVRPFRRGVAPVRRGGWGAVDNNGRVLVPFQYTGYATALTDGRYIDGFTDEGLAIVDAGGRKGVVDRTGRVVVPPAHPHVAIHPVAFLISSPAGRWGALDRRGEPLIDPTLPSRLAVIEEIDRLLADTKPVL
jgi:tetratricopeptide (TPR) repeat protein